jgi:hypothetical protein
VPSMSLSRNVRAPLFEVDMRAVVRGKVGLSPSLSPRLALVVLGQVLVRFMLGELPVPINF